MTAHDATVTRRFERRLESLGELLDWVEAFCPDDESGIQGRVQLVAEELFVNHVRHQPADDPLDVTLSREPGAVSFELVDPRAVHFDPRGHRDPRLDQDADARQPGGMGLELVRRFAQSFDYEFDDGRATTRVVLATDRHDGAAGSTA